MLGGAWRSAPAACRVQPTGPDEGNGPAAQVLAKLGTTLAAVRLAVSATVAEPGVRIDEMMEALADIRGRLTRIETHLAIGAPQDQR
ncbi:MAG TPA: Clp protease N-terminal domain-containing protein [Streptosporangiaceae bacterium]|nr:Clp protease N-terminal domain-containing protein [Streptosporangiaceae bacterium]